MKRLTLIIAAFLLNAICVQAQEWIGIDGNAAMKIQERLVSSSEEEIIVDVKVGGFFTEKVTTPRGEQVIVSAEGMAPMLEAGTPDLPLYSIPIIIGDKSEMKASVLESEYVDFENIEIAPSKGDFSRDINPDNVPYTYGDVYQQDAFYPTQQVCLEKPYIIRDFRGQNMLVYPYAYNPVTKTLRVYTKLRLIVEKVGENGMNQKVSSRSNNTITSEFDASYKRRFINYNNDSRTFLVDEGEMLIVCADKYTKYVQPLIDWKNISGRPTTMVASSETGTDEKLKQYLVEYYKNNPKLSYVLLVGEHADIPAHPMNGGRSDNYFGMLEGDDFYEEVFVGRLSVKNVNDVKNQVNKIIYYERDIDETATWLSNGAGIAAKEGTGHFSEYDYEHMDFIRDTLLNYTYTNVSQHYDKVNNPTVTDLIDRFNEGVGLINYCNHGTVTSWVVTGFNNDNIHQLTNDYKMPFIWSVACDNGSFNIDECFAEAWMRATNPETGAPTGAIGGMFATILQPWRPPMYGQDEMVAILSEWREGYKHTLGGASCNGNMYVLDMFKDELGEETHNTWILFGDPSMMLRTEAPKKMNVSMVPETLLTGMTSLTINADADFGIATLSMNNKIIGSAYVENGIANITFPELTEPGKAQIVVMAYNKVTEIIDLNIMPSTGAYIIVDTLDLNQEDYQMDCDEYIDLSLNVRNIGVESANDITLVLSTTSEFVEIIDSTEIMTTIDVDEMQSLEKAFRFYVKADVPDRERIDFVLTSTDKIGVYETSFSVEAYAPVFVLNEINILPNGMVKPGETATLKLSFDNVGNSKAYDVLTELFVGSSDIDFTNTMMHTEEVAAEETFFVTTDFTVSASAMLSSVYEIIYSVGSKYNTLQSKYDLVIGSISEDFETADFSSYEWSETTENPWVIDNTNAYEGLYCAKSAMISHKQYSALKIELDVLVAGELKFYRRVSSEADSDYLIFFVDGREKERWSGEIDWDIYSYKLSKGKHTVEWRYIKDEESTEGDDGAAIDLISFPPQALISPFEAVSDLKAKKQDNDKLALSWTASENAEEYIVRRNGEIVSTQSETVYYENIADGIYTYSVIARNGDNYSAPAFVIFDSNQKSTESIVESVAETTAIYPNPTSGMVYVDCDKSFDAVVYNYQGQIVMRRNSNDGYVDLSSLTKGVYFLEIRENNNVTIEKIILTK